MAATNKSWKFEMLIQKDWVLLESLLNGIATVLIDLGTISCCVNRGAYNGVTVPGTKPYKDGLEIGVRTMTLAWL